MVYNHYNFIFLSTKKNTFYRAGNFDEHVHNLRIEWLKKNLYLVENTVVILELTIVSVYVHVCVREKINYRSCEAAFCTSAADE